MLSILDGVAVIRLMSAAFISSLAFPVLCGFSACEEVGDAILVLRRAIRIGM